MGYDMNHEIGDPDTEKASDVWWTAEQAGELSREEIHALWEDFNTKQEEANTYFRLNIWGMAIVREVMDEFGMVNTEADHSAFPEAPENMDFDRYHEDKDYQPEYRRAQERALASYEGGGIQLYKLCDNSGWLVTPEEINVALDAYDAFEGKLPFKVGSEYGYKPEPMDKENADGWNDHWRQWIKWLILATERGGFRVH